MPTYRVTVNVEVDDQPLSNFPIVRRVTTQAAQPFREQLTSSASFVALPSTAMASINVAMLQGSQPLAVAFNGVTASPIALNPNAMLVIVDAALTAVSVQNNSGNPATVSALLAGT